MIEIEGSLKKVSLSFSNFTQYIMGVYFASVVKNQTQMTKSKSDSSLPEDMEQYKRLLDKVSSKINKWHKGKYLNHKSTFEFDEEYFEGEASPTRFSNENSDNEISFENVGRNSVSDRLRHSQLNSSTTNIITRQVEMQRKGLLEPLDIMSGEKPRLNALRGTARTEEVNDWIKNINRDIMQVERKSTVKSIPTKNKDSKNNVLINLSNLN